MWQCRSAGVYLRWKAFLVGWLDEGLLSILADKSERGVLHSAQAIMRGQHRQPIRWCLQERDAKRSCDDFGEQRFAIDHRATLAELRRHAPIRKTMGLPPGGACGGKDGL